MEPDELEWRIEALFSAPPPLHNAADGSLVTWGIDTRMLPVFREWVRPGSVTVETGAGVSTILFLLLGAIHRSITPDGREVGRIIDYCDRHGIPTTNYHPIVGSSERVLPALEPEITLDFALIDGNHAFPAPQIDWYYLTDRLRTDGVIALDDVSLWPCRILADFLDEEEVWRRLTRNDRFAVYRMIAPGADVLGRWWGQQPFVVRQSPPAIPVAASPPATPVAASGNTDGAAASAEAPGAGEGTDAPVDLPPAPTAARLAPPDPPLPVPATGRSRPKLTVAVPFPVHPPVGGGQQRAFALYRHVARDFDVELVTLAESDVEFSEREIAPGLREIRVPKTGRHQAEEARLSQEVGGVPVGDIGIDRFIRHTPEYGRHLARSAATAALVVVSHPYCLPPLRRALGDRPLVYEAQDVEYLLKQAVLGHRGEVGAGLVEAVRELEAEACRASRLIMCCSAHDRDELCRLYGVDAERVMIVPNGVDTEAIRFTPPAARERLKAELGVGGHPIALFVGSWHPPNLEAAEAVFEIAAAMPGTTFLLVGSQCIPLADRPRPANVGLMGVVDDETLAVLLAIADIALNPMRSGSGTNLKLATYLAAGVPVITTPIGARGYALADGDIASICSIEDFPARMTAVLGDRVGAEEAARRGRQLVEQRHDWGAIAAEARTALHALVHPLSGPTSGPMSGPTPGPAAGGVDPLDRLVDRVSMTLVELGISGNQRVLERAAAALMDMGVGRGTGQAGPR